MLSCTEITQLISQSLDRNLSFWERLGMRIHILYCSACSRYRRQVQFLRRAMQRWAASAEEAYAAMPGLTEAARERIKRAIRGEGR